jgi:hypothetical protein
MVDCLARLLQSFEVSQWWLRVHRFDHFESSLYLLVGVILFWIWGSIRPVIRIAFGSSHSKR